MIKLLTHRGLNLEGSSDFTESTYESFDDQLRRGFGLEFDLNFTQDEQIVIFHDNGLSRITGMQDQRLFSEMSLAEIKKVKLANGRLCNLQELLQLIQTGGHKVHALHLKGKFQDQKYINILIGILKEYCGLYDRLIIFDTRIDTAVYMKEKIPPIKLAPSVAHTYDIERYNKAVDGTLLSINEAINNIKLFDWVWLDEWDRIDKDGGTKSLYTAEIFNLLRSYKINIALVTPELHATSPNLLGGESHGDAETTAKLRKRIEEIVHLKPDAICTDYPNLVKEIIDKQP